jgi:uncharacterized protein YqgV (UPF0045/DUF77 family)
MIIRGHNPFQKCPHGRSLKIVQCYSTIGHVQSKLGSCQTHFEQDFTAALTVSSVIQKLPEILQKDNESVIQNVSRCADILLGFRTKTDVHEVPTQLQFNTTEKVAFDAIEEAVRTRITRETKQKMQVLTFDMGSSFH